MTFSLPAVPAGRHFNRAAQKEQVRMPPQPLESRVEALELRVTGLEELPGRMDRLESQIVQLREENRVEHSAIRAELQAGHESLRTEIQSVHEEMHAMHAALRAEMQSLNAGLKAELKAELKEQADRQERLTRVLHEDLIGRIAAIGEGLPKRTKGKT
jgi:hypothetical protein